MWEVIGRTAVLLCMLISPLSMTCKTPVEKTSTGAWMQGWSNRIQMTIDHTKIDAALSDFPVLVHLGSSSGVNSANMSAVFDSLNIDADQEKIAVTSADGTTQLYVEIEDWNSVSKEAWLWVKVPNVSSTQDTALFLYYDSAHSDNTQWVGATGSVPAQHVWDNGYVGVWHFGQSGNATAVMFEDSTAWHHNGFGGGDGDGPQQVSSIIDSGEAFNGSDYIAIPSSDAFSIPTTGELTVSLWISPAVLDFDNSVDGLINLMGKGDVDRYEWHFAFYNATSSRPQRISFYVDNPQGGAGSGSYTQRPIAPGTWVYVTAKVYDGYTYIYRNGKLAGRDAYTGPNAYVDVHPRSGTAPVRIGTRAFDGWFQGRIDEVRISDTARSDAWVQAGYLSETDSLMLFTPDEPAVLAPIATKSVTAGQTVSFVVTADAPVGRPLQYSAFNLPAGAEFDPLTRTFSWAPGLSQIGTYPDITFEVVSGGLTDSESVTLTVVRPGESRPVGDGFPPTNLFHISRSLALLGALIVAAALMLLTMLAVILRRHRQGVGR